MEALTGGRADRLDPATRMVAATVVLGLVMSSLDTTIVNVALNDLARDFSVSLPTVHWVGSSYLLALAIAIPLTGWATERFGGKRVWMTAVGVFLAGSVLAGIAWSIESLIAFRILQGFGGGMIIPVGTALLVRTAGPRRLGAAMGFLGIAQLIGPVLGPVLGGLLVEHGGWRWIFYVNVPVGALALLLAARHLPAHPPTTRAPLDVTGLVLLSPGLAALVYGLAELSDGGAGSHAGAPIIAGVALIAAFVVHARHAANPLINVRLLQRRALAAAAGTAFCLGMTFYGTMFLLPLYYQSARGVSALDAGLLIAPQGLGTAIMMPFAGRATDRFGPGRVVPVGLTLMFLGTLPFVFAGTSTPYPLLAAALFVRGLGMGSSLMPATAGAYATLSGSGVPSATSTISAVQRIGGSLGVALIAVVLDYQLRAPAAAGGTASGEAASAYGSTFTWAVALGALAFLPAAFLPRRPAAAEAQTAATATARARPRPRRPAEAEVS